MRNISRLVFIIICVLATVDTHLFVYPSLSRYLLLENGIVVMAAMLFGVVIAKRHILLITRHEVLLITWIAYIILHGLFMSSCEQYRTIYLCSTLLLAILLANMQRCKLLTRNDIASSLLLVASIQLVCIMGQHTGLIDSGNKYFRITGCNENPTVTALYLAGCLPMMAARIITSKARIAYGILFAVSLYGIILLRCRTAYIGASIEITIFLILNFVAKLNRLIIRPLHAGVLGLVLLSIVIAIGTGLYNMKRNSADGRILIWKLSSEMIAEDPWGYGYGLFEKNYNLKQADYFANRDFTATEERNASFVYMPYNDFLEHGVEGGIIGMLFLLTFYVVMIWKTLQSRKKEDAAVFCSFAIMSLFNFVYTSILPWLLLMCYASFVIYEERSLIARKCFPQYAVLILFVTIGIASLKVAKMTMAQLELKKLEEQPTHVSDREYAQIEAQVGTSEAYWTSRAINSISMGQFDDALTNIHQARVYSSLPTLFMAEQYCLLRMNRIEESVKCRDTLSNMAPQRLGIYRMNQ